MAIIVGDRGINHNGNVETAIQIALAAYEAGFDYVKMQKRNPDLYPDRPYTSPVFGETTYREHKRGLELSAEDWGVFDEAMCDYGIDWFASPFDTDSVDFLTGYSMPYWKIASPCVFDLALVDNIGRTAKAQGAPVIISTGMQSVSETRLAVTVLSKYLLPKDIDILHCCSEYPTPSNHANLLVIQRLKAAYPGHSIGYSSHDAGILVPATAAVFGAEIIEVHITLNRAWKGSDQAASIEPDGMRLLVQRARILEQAMGDGIKEVYEGEQIIKAKVMQNANGIK